MLKPNMNGVISTLKFVSGEEIIAKVLNEDDKKITLVNPLLMVMVDGGEYQGYVTFTPWLLAASDDQQIDITKDKIIVCIKASADAEAQYKNATNEVDVEKAVAGVKSAAATPNRVATKGRH